MLIPTNENIKISPLGEERKFISGTKYWLIDWAEFKGERFEKNTKVVWYSPDNKNYKGSIEWMMIDEDGGVQISITNPHIGRLDLDDVIKIKK